MIIRKLDLDGNLIKQYSDARITPIRALHHLYNNYFVAYNVPTRESIHTFYILRLTDERGTPPVVLNISTVRTWTLNLANVFLGGFDGRYITVTKSTYYTDGTSYWANGIRFYDVLGNIIKYKVYNPSSVPFVPRVWNGGYWLVRLSATTIGVVDNEFKIHDIITTATNLSNPQCTDGGYIYVKDTSASPYQVYKLDYEGHQRSNPFSSLYASLTFDGRYFYECNV
jgi:hypothetical protein